MRKLALLWGTKAECGFSGSPDKNIMFCGRRWDEWVINYNTDAVFTSKTSQPLCGPR